MSNDWTQLLTLPSCFWDYSQQFNYFYIAGPIYIPGSSKSGQAADPLMGFGRDLDYIRLQNVSFFNPVSKNGNNAGTYTVNWPSLFARYPNITYLRIENARLGGSMPSTFPALLEDINLTNNRITGTISPQWLNRTGVEYPWIELGGNKLSGALPSNLFSLLNDATSKMILDIDNNEITGTIPSNLFTSSELLRKFDYLYFRVGGNRLTGTLPASLLSASFPYLEQLTLEFDLNALSGTIPSDLFSSFDAPCAVSIFPLVINILALFHHSGNT